MLLEFSVANFLSFKERQTLSLVASRDKVHPGNTFRIPDSSDLSLLKSVAIYGANASGKSNLVKALIFLRNFVLNSANSRNEGVRIPVTAFKLSSQMTKQPSELEVVIATGGSRYVYGFRVDTRKVHEEWLSVTPGKGQSRMLFRRSDDGTVEFGTYWRGDRKRLRHLVRPEALVLSVAAQLRNPVAKPVYDWFSEKLRTISDRPEEESEKRYTVELLEDPQLQESLTSLLRHADLGISAFRASSEPLPLSDLQVKLPDGSVAKLELASGAAQELTVAKVATVHRTADGEDIELDLDTEESAGTNRLFAIAGPWIYVFSEGCVLLIDELDSKLHPLLTRLLVRLMHGSETNPQLVFTTHDCSLLDSQLFRRDQIWFTEKDAEGATHLYSLWDYDVRKDDNFRSGYLKGRFGAIPFVGELAFGKPTD